MRLIITRPQDDAQATLARLRALGHDGLAAPLISISPRLVATLPDRRWQALLVSSANAVRSLVALGRVQDFIDVPLFAVGEASATAARECGFRHVHSADGDLKALFSVAASKLSPSAGPLLYLSGTVISGDLQGMLEKQGFQVSRVEIYEAISAANLPEEARVALHENRIDGVGLFSRRSANIWMSLILKANIFHKAKMLNYFCLSQAVASEIIDSWPVDAEPPHVFVSPRMDMDGFLESIAKAH